MSHESRLSTEQQQILTDRGYKLTSTNYCPSCGKRHEYWYNSRNSKTLDIISNKGTFTFTGSAQVFSLQELRPKLDEVA